MYELYLNGNKVKQINYIGEHDYTPVVEQVEAPMITYNSQNWIDSQDCNNGKYAGYTTVNITCETAGASIYYRYGVCTVDANCNTTAPDLTNEPWVLGDSITIYNNDTNTCDDGREYYYIEAKATKSGMDDSTIEFVNDVEVEPDESIDCNDCNNWQELGYPSYEDCDCAVNGINCPVDCSDWENLGYESYEDCDCQVNGNCVDCNDCSNWAECGYSSYEDCDCQVNGNCGETDCTDCENWQECGYTSWDDCAITNDGVFPSPEISGGIDGNVSGTTSNIVLMVTDVENLEWKVDYGYSIYQNYVTNWTAGSYVSGSGTNSLYNYTRSDPWTDVDGYAHIKVTMRRDGVESETHHYKFNYVSIIEITE